MKLVLFEDNFTSDLLPLVYFRPTWELRCGARTLQQKIQRISGQSCMGYARDYLQQNYLEQEQRPTANNASDALWINARWIPSESGFAEIESLEKNEALVYENALVAARVQWKTVEPFLTAEGLDSAGLMATLRKRSGDAILFRYIWQLVHQNGNEIVRDFQREERGQIFGTVDEGVHILEKERVHLGNGSRLKPGVVVDAEHGPVWIEDNVTVMPNAVLEGPLYIGANSTIKIAAKIYENTTIGPWCKIGGELEESIVQGYSNKQHDGFLGHAYLGSWVNLGADTNNSDLKNNYGTITALVNGKPVETGSQFVGLIMGDHSKSAINMMFNTGTIVGVNSNIFCSGMPPKFVPSFSWGGDTATQYGFEKAVEVAAAVMKRRKVNFTDADHAIFKWVWQSAKALEKGSPIS
ncbi:MAG: GlmU family protein [Calditrichia bacterium]